MGAKVTPVAIASSFSDEMKAVKDRVKGVAWYPYDILARVRSLEPITPEWVSAGLVAGFKRAKVLDVGAADGDLGYLFASRGCRVHFLDNPPTNFNKCQGVRQLGKALKLKHKLIERDVDQGLRLRGQYDLALCLGILYHLRNPMLLLMELARHAQCMFLSTRVSTHFPDGTLMADNACAYLLDCRESNDDPTNYWNLSPKGLRVLLKRSGWMVKGARITGPEVSNPVDRDADARMFVFCERVANWSDLGRHHDF